MLLAVLPDTHMQASPSIEERPQEDASEVHER